MSNYEKRDNSGTLGKNERREKDTHPEYTGAATIDGRGYWINAWIKTNRESGEKFFSLSFQPKTERKERPAAAPERPDSEFDSDIPF